MKIQTIAGFALATVAGAALSRIPWPTGDRFQSGLDQFLADSGRGLDALAFELAALIDRGGAATGVTDAAMGAASASGSVMGWAAGVAGILLVVAGGALLVARNRAGSAATAGTSAAGAARPATTGSAPAGKRSRRWGTGRDSLARLEHARSLAAAGSLGGDVARESALSRDAVELLLHLGPDAIAGKGDRTGRTFRRSGGRSAVSLPWPFSSN